MPRKARREITGSSAKLLVDHCHVTSSFHGVASRAILTRSPSEGTSQGSARLRSGRQANVLGAQVRLQVASPGLVASLGRFWRSPALRPLGFSVPRARLTLRQP